MPDGTPKKETPLQLKSIARGYTDICVNVLRGNVTSEQIDADIKLRSAIALLDRGWGKPAQSIEHTGADGGAIEVIIRDLMAEQREKKKE